MPKRPMTWGEIYRANLARGYDHGYAAWRADEAERKRAKKKSTDDDKEARMGYGCYEMNGRDQGHMVPAKCDHPGCEEEINRGMGYACGGEPTENCGLFFCSRHRSHDVDPEAEWTAQNRHTFGVCERCASEAEPFDPSPDTEYWRAWKMNHASWSGWRAENPDFVRDNAHLIGHSDVMSEIDAA